MGCPHGRTRVQFQCNRMMKKKKKTTTLKRVVNNNAETGILLQLELTILLILINKYCCLRIAADELICDGGGTFNNN